jgi:CheY-like chemotaxis protein
VGKLLLVEDDPMVRMLAYELLQDEGFTVLEAADGDEAIRMLDGMDQLDILVTDVRMPGGHDGVQVAQHARRRFPRLPIMVMTGFAANIGERLLPFDPKVSLVEKPYQPDRMVALARSLSGIGNRQA